MRCSPHLPLRPTDLVDPRMRTFAAYTVLVRTGPGEQSLVGIERGGVSATGPLRYLADSAKNIGADAIHGGTGPVPILI